LGKEGLTVKFDAATLNRAAAVIRSVTADLPADAALREVAARNHGWSASARSAVARAVFAHYRWFGWLDPREALQRRIDHALSLQRTFDATPAAIKPEALAERAVPAWLRGEVVLGPDDLRQLQREPALWLRARPGTAPALAAELGDCAPPPGAPGLPPTADALRYRGVKDLFRTEPFRRGAFEIQDLASQLVTLACNPKPGQTWWDACAGEGGKALHLADLMENRGLIWATDRSARRLERLRERFARAERFNVRTAPWDGSARLPTRTAFDGILVDAPCSGVGTWQRNPHARWTCTPNDVAELAAVQLRLLDLVAPALKPGGRLVYAVCTLTRSETEGVVEAFGAAHPELVPVAPFAATGDSNDARLRVIRPAELGSNGMAIAVWIRR
jgi:16S rRNA (cytosine967-C5)-methyltransferase